MNNLPQIIKFMLCNYFVSKVAGTQLYDWSLQGYIAVESLWKDNAKKKKPGKKDDKVRSRRNLISGLGENMEEYQ